MIKKIIQISAAVLLLIYLTFSVAFINPKVDANKECGGVQIAVMETTDALYLNEPLIEALLEKANVCPTGRKMSEIHIGSIEKALKEHKWVKNTEVYKTIDGMVKIRVYQRTPILRVISEKRNYYIDAEGQIMPVPLYYTAYVPLATGAISDEYATKQLCDFARFLHKNESWGKQIEQIHVLPNLDVELTPRKGDHIIVLGKIENYKENLDKLALFYEKGLNVVGWNKYSQINLKYKNQVVCTKKE